MLTALGLDDTAAARVLPAAEPTRARSGRSWRRRPRISASLPSASRSTTRCADAIGAALLATPEDGQLVITGSLYTVGAARGVFVKSDRYR